jgi:Family of unknown function (DUF6399)
MTPPHTTPHDSPSQGPFRWGRCEAASLLHRALHSDHPSLRRFAEQHGVPPSTLRHWKGRLGRIPAPPALRDFLESPEGQELLRRLVLAAHLCFQQAGACGVRPLLAFFEHAGLAPFLALCFGSHQRIASALRGLLLAYGRDQRRALAAGMPARQVSLCEDETFHRRRCCLVAVEPASNFIVLERYEPKRDQATWDRAVAEALQGLPVEVEQVSSDQARAILAHAKRSLGAAHSPDLMHAQQALHRATALPLAAQAERAQQEVERAWDRRAEAALAKVAWQTGPRPPGRPPDFEARQEPLRRQHRQAEADRDGAQARQRQVKEAIRGLADDYHPFDSQTGQPLTELALQGRLGQRLGAVEQAAQDAGLSEVGRKEIGKVRGLLPALVATLAWFWARARAEAEQAGWTAERAALLAGPLLGWAYWERAARRGRNACERARLKGLAGRPWAQVEGSPVWGGLSEQQRGRMRGQARQLACKWVRSSSCVEGRNGLLRLRQHGKGGLSEQELGVLTVLANCWVRRPDGTTAAERFFGRRPEDLFGWLLERFGQLPRPAKPRRRAA